MRKINLFFTVVENLFTIIFPKKRKKMGESENDVL